jgi:TatD DNase family protein
MFSRPKLFVPNETIEARGPMLTDAHSHIGDARVLAVLAKFNIFTLACGTDPSECAQLRQWAAASRHITPTYGLHPWKADRHALAEMLPYLRACPVIGEIGMDSRWARAPLAAQRRAFLAQLSIAERRGVPVILHTAGQEEEIAEIISAFRMPVLVHWYDCDRFLERYIGRGCYFTVGEAIERSAHVRAVAACAPIDRLLVETDGIDAIRWLRKRRDVPLDEIPRSLRRTLAAVARIRSLDVGEVTRIVNENFFRFARICSPTERDKQKK